MKYIGRGKKMFDGQTKITGIFGDPVAHSLSPAMQNAAFKSKGLNYVYLPFPVRREHLPEAARALIPLGLAGINVTSPHKETIIPFLHELSSEAEFMGAVNTVAARDGRLKGFNTDVVGFLYLLQNLAPLSVKGERVCLLGAGGAARAVSVALARSKVGHVAICCRTMEKGGAIREMLSKNGLLSLKETSVWLLNGDTFPEVLRDSAFIINTLSVDPVEKGLLPANKRYDGLKAAIDVRYSPPKTPFLKWASSANKGCRTVNGLDMLLGQGTATFEIFTGLKAPFQIMKEALQKQLAGKPGENK